MKHLAVLLILFSVPAVAGEVKPSPNGTLIGPDGKVWRVEGCAAYPVEDQVKAPESKSLKARLKKKAARLAASTPKKD